MGTVRYTTVNGKIIAEKRNGVRSRYISDSLGSTVALLDNTQTKTDTFEYWPYGEVRNRTGTNPTPFQHVGTLGYYKDSASKTQVRARELDNANTRWMTQDPLGFAGDDWNLYRYVANMVASATDPSGERRNYGQWDSNCRRWNGPGWHSCSKPQWDACLAKCAHAGGPDHCCSNGEKFGGETSGSGFDCTCRKPIPPGPSMPSCPCGCGGKGGPNCTCGNPPPPPPPGGGRKQIIWPLGPGKGCMYNCAKCTFSFPFSFYTFCTPLTSNPIGCPANPGTIRAYGLCNTGYPIEY